MESSDVVVETDISHCANTVIGFEYDFEPVLESKYECPICLMCMRDCVQTSCGHKFCGPCIVAWIKQRRGQCPQDNRILSEDDLYPDNYTRREILQLTVKCPNWRIGCSAVIAVCDVDQHVTICQYQIVACPNRCSMRTTRRDVDEHCQHSCLRRIVNCSMCQASFQLNQQNVHLSTCVMVRVSCESCQSVVLRGELQRHLLEECARAEVACSLSDVGCKERMPRAELLAHMQEHTQHHMKLLAQAYRHVTGFMSDLGRAVDTLSCSSQTLDHSATCTTNSQLPTNDLNSLHVRRVSSPCCDTPGAVGGGGVQTAGAGCSPLEKRLQVDLSSLDLNCKIVSPEKFIKDICEKNVRLEQRSREQAIQIDNLKQKLRQLSENTAVERLQMHEQMMRRCCGGVFVWTIHSFSSFISDNNNNNNNNNNNASASGKVLHSPSFYTSPYGYCVCVRASVRVYEGQKYLGLFVHMSRGDNDDVLDWPFTGRFIISLVDQSDSCVRHDFTELMSTRPGLDAFERPREERNMKGWGLAQFVSVSRVVEQFARRDSVIIKCVVQCGSSASSLSDVSNDNNVNKTTTTTTTSRDNNNMCVSGLHTTARHSRH